MSSQVCASDDCGLEAMAASASAAATHPRKKAARIIATASRVRLEKVLDDIVGVEHAGRRVDIAHDVVVRGTVVGLVDREILAEREAHVAGGHVVPAERADR